jgi:ectoine hydroxylase-related dioxygenase (phytanoyl-CoA dioxygenase family)
MTQRFHRDGYVVVEQLLTMSEVATLRQRFAAIARGEADAVSPQQVGLRDVPGRGSFGRVAARPAEPPETPEPHTTRHRRRGHQVFPAGGEELFERSWAPVTDPLDAVTYLHVLRHDPVLAQFIHHPRILDVVSVLMSPNIKLYYDQVFAKAPYGGANRYHQDSVFWKFFASNDLLTCWLAVDDSTIANGCVRYLPGSHRFGLVDWDYLPYLLTEDLLAQEVMVPLRAGDAICHHSLTLHCSGPNTTPTRRWGWALHFVPAETRYIGTPEDDEHLRQIGALDRPDPRNGFPLLRGREFPGCV